MHSSTVDIFCQALEQRDTTMAPGWKKNYLQGTGPIEGDLGKSKCTPGPAFPSLCSTPDLLIRQLCLNNCGFAVDLPDLPFCKNPVQSPKKSAL